MADLPEILEQEDLTVERLFYLLLREETKGLVSRPSERRRITNRPRRRHPEG